jgi:hypothetical protein
MNKYITFTAPNLKELRLIDSNKGPNHKVFIPYNYFELTSLRSLHFVNLTELVLKDYLRFAKN